MPIAGQPVHVESSSRIAVCSPIRIAKWRGHLRNLMLQLMLRPQVIGGPACGGPCDDDPLRGNP
eukprot:2896247-Pyramimonas_sp.AAC.1